MTDGWRRRWSTRQLRALLEPEEEVALVERLGVGGWWMMTDRALYVIDHPSDHRRFPLSDISSVATEYDERIATIRTINRDVVIVTVPRRSAVLECLTQLQPPMP